MLVFSTLWESVGGPVTSLTGMKIRSSYIIRQLKLVLTAELLMKLDFTNVKSTLFLLLLAIQEGKYCLLILDGYGSHLTSQFD